MAEKITFSAEIIKVQQMVTTMAVRITLDLPESCTMQMAQLAEAKRMGAVLEISATPTINTPGLTEFDDETEKNTEGNPAGVDSRRIDLRRSKQ